MTQASLDFNKIVLRFIGRPPTFTEKVATKLLSRRGQWIDGLELAKVGGAYAWRSRLSDVRKMGYTVENRQRRIGKKVVSEYRIPA